MLLQPQDSMDEKSESGLTDKICTCNIRSACPNTDYKHMSVDSGSRESGSTKRSDTHLTKRDGELEVEEKFWRIRSGKSKGGKSKF